MTVEMQQDGTIHPWFASHQEALDIHAFEPSEAAAITVMLATGRKALNASWSSMLAREPGIDIKDEPAMDATCLAACVERHLPKVLLLDKALLDGLDAQSLRRIHAQGKHVRVLLLWHEISHGLVADVLRNRFNGFMLTTCLPDVTLKAIRAVSKGDIWMSHDAMAISVTDLPVLPGPAVARVSANAIPSGAAEALTPRELQVAALVRTGCINKEIGRALGITEGTVKKHLQSVFAKLGVHRRTLVALRRLPESLQFANQKCRQAAERNEGLVHSAAAACRHDPPPP